MSVKSTVASTRSSATSACSPVRNSAISWKDCAPRFDEVVHVAPRQLNVFRARYVIGDVLAPRGRDDRVVGVVEDESRHADCRKHRPHVQFEPRAAT